MATIKVGGCNHTKHLILTILTFGAWFPIWVLVWLFSSKTKVKVGRPTKAAQQRVVVNNYVAVPYRVPPSQDPAYAAWWATLTPEQRVMVLEDWSAGRGVWEQR